MKKYQNKFMTKYRHKTKHRELTTRGISPCENTVITICADCGLKLKEVRIKYK